MILFNSQQYLSLSRSTKHVSDDDVDDEVGVSQCVDTPAPHLGIRESAATLQPRGHQL